MSQHTHKHRHAVVLPAFLCVLALQVSLLGSELRATSLHAAEAATQYGSVQILPEGKIAIAPGDVPSLEQGNVLVYGSLAVRLKVDQAVLTAFHGGYFVSAQGTATTIAAISTPVLVQVGGQSLFVPEHMQIRLPSDLSDLTVASFVSALQPVPRDFSQRRALVITQAIDTPEAKSNLQTETAQSRFGTGLAWMQLPAARERAAAETEAKKRIELIQRAENITPAELFNLITEIQAEPDGSTEERLLELLLRTASRPTLGSLVLQALSQDDIRLLGYVHPLLRPSAWVPGTDTVPLPVLMQFSLQDLAQDSAGQAVVEAFAASVVQLDPEDQSQVLTAMQPFVHTAREQGLSERLRWYANAFEPIDSTLLTPQAGTILESLRNWEQLIVPAVAKSTSSASSSVISKSSSSVQVSTPFDSVAAEEQLKDQLQEAGALFTTKTSIVARDAAHVQVQGLLFAQGSGHHAYTFTYDSVSKEVKDITQDGTLMPYPMLLSDFTRWARGE
jgi:hypothetical protein